MATPTATASAPAPSAGGSGNGNGNGHHMNGHEHTTTRVTLPGTLSDKGSPGHPHAAHHTHTDSKSSGSHAVVVHHAATGSGSMASNGSDGTTFVVSVRSDGVAPPHPGSATGTTMSTPATAATGAAAIAAPGTVSGHHAVGAVPPCWLGPTEAKRPTRDIRMTCGHFSMQGVRNEMEGISLSYI
jgi:hypothetical protein